jgi:hypothetical protein
MDELESQIAKIQLGNFKNANSYVYVFAEKAGGSDAELYVVAELPLLNPAAEDSCEKICLSIASTLKRTYKKPLSSGSFENAISQINEELGKLVSLGQTQWMDKLSCIIAVKESASFTIATTGKVSSFLLRGEEFTDISCSSLQTHPLKTFENYASGKIRLGDLLVLSTTQLFNYLSMDRFRTIVTGSNFLSATQTIIELLKENAGPEVAFGTLLNLQVAVGQTAEEEIDLEDYLIEKPLGHESFGKKAFNYVKTLFALDTGKRMPKVGLPKLSLKEQIKNIGGNTKNLVSKSRWAVSNLRQGLKNGRTMFNLQNFKQYSPQKKFFFISAIVLLLTFAINLTVTGHYRKVREAEQKQATELKGIQGFVSNAQASLLYRDENAARDFLSTAKQKLPAQESIKDANKGLYDQINSEVKDLELKIEKVTEVNPTSLGGLATADFLIKLPNYLAAPVNGNIVSYDKTSSAIEDGKLKSSQNILASTYVDKNLAVIYNGSELLTWDFVTEKTGSPHSFSVPAKEDFVGLAYYPTNSRVYTVSKKSGQVISFAVIGSTLSKAVIAAQDNALKEAKDLTIDTNVYVLTSSGINKYTAGKKQEFKMPTLLDPFSGSGKIYTHKDFKNIYILDTGKNRVIVIDKAGNLITILKSSQFTKLVDFQVDEKNKTIFVLNGGNLLKFGF